MKDTYYVVVEITGEYPSRIKEVFIHGDGKVHDTYAAAEKRAEVHRNDMSGGRGSGACTQVWELKVDLKRVPSFIDLW